MPKQLGEPTEQFLQDAAARPLQRVGRPEDIAQAALYLASEASSFVTGSPAPRFPESKTEPMTTAVIIRSKQFIRGIPTRLLLYAEKYHRILSYPPLDFSTMRIKVSGSLTYQYQGVRLLDL